MGQAMKTALVVNRILPKIAPCIMNLRNRHLHSLTRPPSNPIAHTINKGNFKAQTIMNLGVTNLINLEFIRYQGSNR